MIARSDVGMVLGSKGRTLQKLTSDTWTWSKVFQGEHSSEFSIRGYTERDVDECVKRLLSIAQESYRRRTTGQRHVKSGTISALSMVGDFQLAPVPQSRRKRSSGSTGSPPAPSGFIDGGVLPSPHSPPPAPTGFIDGSVLPSPPTGLPSISSSPTMPTGGDLSIYSAESPTYSPVTPE